MLKRTPRSQAKSQQLRCNPSVLSLVPSEEREALERRIVGSKDLLELFEKALLQALDANRKERISKGSFDSPSWAYLQAYHNGYEAGVQKALNTIELTNMEVRP